MHLQCIPRNKYRQERDWKCYILHLQRKSQDKDQCSGFERMLYSIGNQNSKHIHGDSLAMNRNSLASKNIADNRLLLNIGNIDRMDLDNMDLCIQLMECLVVLKYVFLIFNFIRRSKRNGKVIV